MEHFYSAKAAGMIWPFLINNIALWFDADDVGQEDGSNVTKITSKRFAGIEVNRDASTGGIVTLEVEPAFQYFNYPTTGSRMVMDLDSRLDIDYSRGQAYFFLVKPEGTSRDQGRGLAGTGVYTSEVQTIDIWKSSINVLYNTSTLGNGAYSLSDWSVVSVISRPNSQSIRINGVEVATSTHNISTWSTTNAVTWIGDTYRPFRGGLSDLIFTCGYPCDESIASIETYLMKKRARILANCWLTTTASSVSFDITATNGTTLTVDWGDNTATEDFAMTGSIVNVSRNYGSAATRKVTMIGSAVPNITRLDIKSNSITSVDVSSCIRMTLFLCFANDLTAIDVSKNILLEYFYFYSNDVTTIDISTNTELTNFHCGVNQLTSLDISNNTKISTIWFYGNSLTTVDVSNNTALRNIYAIENALTSTCVNAILALLVSLSRTSGTVELEDQDPAAAPTGQGITDKATLIAAGVTVTTD